MTNNADTYAADIARTLGFAEPPGASALADAVWGASSVGLVTRGPDAQLVRRGPRSWCLFLCRSVPRPTRHWLIARHVAAHCLAIDGATMSSAQVGGAITMPSDALDDVLSEDTYEGAAERFGLPLAATMLRHAELRNVPTALVTEAWSRVRGDTAGRLPRDHATLRAIASARVGVVGLRRTLTPDGETLIQVA